VRTQSDAAGLLRAPRDAFTARFVGYENVLDADRLRGGPADGLRRWLAERAGPEGLAFAAPVWSGGIGPAPWTGVVRSARPGPQGLTLELLADGLLVTLRMPTPVEPPVPGVGERLRFSIDAAALHPLGPIGGAA
jgi:hypothetical protein